MQTLEIIRKVVTIPKTVHTHRMKENLNIWDFELSQEDMDKIAMLDIGHSEIVDHSNKEFVKMLHSMKVHQ